MFVILTVIKSYNSKVLVCTHVNVHTVWMTINEVSLISQGLEHLHVY